mgnify:CR=1 FL=1
MNSYGTKFRLSIFGESHGPLIGVVLDGVPAGMPLSREDFLADLDRRRSGAKGSTPRKESDLPEIVSGVCDGHTTGAPLTIVFRNSNTRSGDYSDFRATPRPGHADFVAERKYRAFNDLRGGGHFSGRLTLTLVASFALRLIEKLMDGSDSYELAQGDQLVMAAGTYSHPDRNPGPDHRAGRYSPRAAELRAGEGIGRRGCPDALGRAD